ncbi:MULTISPECIES: translational GTPase TypA [Gammaproteobacteria]|uniref:Large ribosomal subunit assembly factor BipA n=1 Tax=Vreelandella halophila TaxID=86177 RepID=A0A9X4YDG8_9GAMM|nr:translational GTPase TypA [Halospina sp. K52047b]KAA8982545.1 translational GTPase TypA [Halospina sp. K52047b]MYL27639.1 translational GTPase TypA [Halomonas utahensis]MYL75369.1 translational GTPase TypA [Halomonas sp. 22501_18_FS]
MIENLRNIAIIAHVDHGKTTLVDQLLQQSGTLDRKSSDTDRIMDSDDQEKERGITILSKNTAINWGEYRINIVDTPGHADFGGEVERVMSMVDSVLLLVDAVDGPMPQTRFVTQKAFAKGLNPIVVVNKVDREGARPDWVINEVFDLFDALGANEDQLDFPIVYASALNGIAGEDPDALEDDMDSLFKMIVNQVPAPSVDPDASLQMQVSSLDYDPYVGVLGVGRIKGGQMKPGQQVAVINREGEQRNAKLLEVKGFLGLNRVNVDEANAGDIVCISGISNLRISDTICSREAPEAMPALTVDEPTVSMTFQVNDSPFAGQDGKYVTSRQIKERLEQELLHNVALRVEQGDAAEKFTVSGRGELHLAVLIENMRREGFELGVSRPEVVQRENNGAKEEPYEQVVVDIEEQHQGSVMEEMGNRRAEMQNMVPDGRGRVRIDFIMPARGLIGFRSQFLTLTQGSGILTHVFDHWGPVKGGMAEHRHNGAIVSMVKGTTTAYSLFTLQDRGRLMVGPGAEVYEGMVIGIHARENDLTVNPTKGKQLTNVRAAGTDENLVLTPPIEMTLENALEFIDDDELVEVTPNNLRVRKKLLTETDRKRAGKK